MSFRIIGIEYGKVCSIHATYGGQFGKYPSLQTGNFFGHVATSVWWFGSDQDCGCLAFI